MSEINPYKPPESPAASAATAEAGNFIAAGRAVDAGHGWEWIASGFALFKKQPGIWVVLGLILMAFFWLASNIAFIGWFVITLLFPVLVAGIMIGCRALKKDENLEIGHLFAGFKQNTSNLFMLGVLTLVAWIIVYIPAILVMGVAGFMAMMRGDAAAIIALGLTFLLAMLVMLALSIPIYMAVWFAPSLIVFHDLAPVEAMKTSFIACLKNIIPFLLYGVIMLVLMVIAAIPIGLGFLVLMPVILASVYTAYRDIFFAA